MYHITYRRYISLGGLCTTSALPCARCAQLRRWQTPGRPRHRRSRRHRSPRGFPGRSPARSQACGGEPSPRCPGRTCVLRTCRSAGTARLEAQRGRREAASRASVRRAQRRACTTIRASPACRSRIRTLMVRLARGSTCARRAGASASRCRTTSGRSLVKATRRPLRCRALQPRPSQRAACRTPSRGAAPRPRRCPPRWRPRCAPPRLRWRRRRAAAAARRRSRGRTAAQPHAVLGAGRPHQQRRS